MDNACLPDEDPEFRSIPEQPTTEYHVVHALRLLGYETRALGVGSSIESVLQGLQQQDPHMVFNLTEVFRDSREHDRNIAALIELLGLPFTGTGAAGLLLCRDKGLCKQLLRLHHIRVPGFAMFFPGRRIRAPRGLRFPLVVKPALADGSEGISNASLVADPDALTERVQWVQQRWEQPAIAEEYVEGRELYVGVLGNRRLTVLPPRELFFEHPSANGPLLATYRVKWDAEYQARWKVHFGFADLDSALEDRVRRVCRRAYRVLRLQDFGRIDLRITPGNEIVVLEANPNPDIAYGEEVAESAEKAGIGYEDLIGRIVRLAFRRHARPRFAGRI